MTIDSQSTAAETTEDRPPLGKAKYLRDRSRERSFADASRYRHMLDALPAAIYSTDAEGRITHFNTAAVELSGRTPELGSDRWCVSWKLYHADGTPMPHDQCPMAVALREGRAVRGETAILERPDGTRVRFMPYPTPLFDDDGRVIGAINMLVDVTERMRDEAKIRASEARLASEAEALSKLNELASRLWRAPTLRAGLDEMLAAIVELMGADFGNVQLLDSARKVLRIEAQIGFDQPFLDFFRDVTAEDDSACGRALRTGQRIHVEDVEADELFGPMRPVAREAGFRAVQSTPLIGRDGEPLGMLSTHWRHPHLPDGQSLRRLDLYVRQAIDFIERNRIEDTLQAKQLQLADELHATELLQRVSMHLPRTADFQSLYSQIMDAAVAIMRSDFASIQMYDSQRGTQGELRLLAFRGFDPQAAKFWEWVRADSGCTCGQAFRTRQRAIAADVENCDFMAGTPDRAAYLEAGMRAAQSTPLISRSGKLLGMLSTHWKRPHEPAQRDLRLLDVLARQAADWMERQLSETALRQSEERFRGFASATSDLIYRMNPDWTEMRRLRGREFIPDTLAATRSWLETYVHPDDQTSVREAIRKSIDTRSNFELEYRVVREDGTTGWTHSRAIPLLAEDGEIIEWIGAASDVTQRKASEEGLRLRETIMAGQREALEAAINDVPLETSLGVLVRTAIDVVGQDVRAGFYLANADRTALHHIVGMCPEYAKAVDGFTVGPDSLACGLATHTGKPVLTSDVRNEPLWQPWLWMAEKFDYRACWSFPIQSAQDSFFGTLAVYSRKPREATARDVEFCGLITHTASLIISRHTEVQARKRIERALRVSEERHRQTLSLMPAAVYSCDATGALTYFNQQAVQLWGRTPKLGDRNERFCGSARLILPDGTPLPHEKCPMAIALHERRSFRNAEVNIERPDGSLVEVLVNIDPVLNEQGKVVGAINAFHDVSAIKRAEQARRESERRLAAELASMTRLHELSVELARRDDLAAVLEEVMIAASQLLGSARCTAQLVEQHPTGQVSLRLVASAGFDEEFADAFRTVKSDGYSTCAATLNRREAVLVEDLASSSEFERFASVALPLGVRAAMSIPLGSSEGEILGVFTAYWDRAHRPNAHELRMLDLFLQQVARQIERRAAEKALRESEMRFRMVADNMAQLAWTCDTLGNVTWYNKRWLEYTGLAFEEMKGWEWSKVQHPEHLDRVLASIRHCAETGEPWEDTFPLRGADGSYRWFLSRAVPIYGDGGEIVRWFGTNTDVTDWREAEQALKEADRRKDEFLATLAHELRNPLAPIRNSLHILRLAGNDLQTVCRVRDMMDRQLNHMVRLVDDLMEVSRITRGKIELRKEQIDLAAAVQSAVETSRPLIEAAGHQLTVTLPPESLVLEADPVRLAQVFTNLLNNAAKYTEKGGRISLAVRREACGAIVSIRDTGIGIPANMLARVFDLFTQVDNAYGRAQGGLGIGLTLARSLVSLHGGTIEAKSDGPRRGSEFVVRLPLAPARAMASDEHRRDAPPVALSARRILVVDDNQDAAESLAMLLRFLGADVRTANNGDHALQALETYRPSAILLDIGMPGIDGLEVARRARRQSGGRNVTLVALTGWGQEEDRRRSREAGFDHHLVKPLNLDALQDVLKSLE